MTILTKIESIVFYKPRPSKKYYMIQQLVSIFVCAMAINNILTVGLYFLMSFIFILNLFLLILNMQEEKEWIDNGMKEV